MPQETILRTKLFPPPLRRNLVPRPRLLNKLSDSFCPETRLTLVCAPAGFGKTTVVTEWLSEITSDPLSGAGGSGVRAAWITCDETDNDPIRFWRYFVAALQSIDLHLGESILPVLYVPKPPPFHTLLGELVDNILSVDLEFLLVWGGYHHIENELIHESVNLLIDNLPLLAHPVIITRSDPPLQLARRRAHGELCELRAADLRFTGDEADQLFNQTMRLGLSTDDVSALEDRTEGWIAGLQMAAISLQDVTEPHTFVASFRGDDRYIADYLLEEVLQRQPVEFQQFMLQTSVLDRLSGSLCDAVTGRNDSQAVLNTLERANLFILPLDNHREWFRYHQLFANLLEQRLLDTAGAAAVFDLKHRASQWYAAHGNFMDAVEIALSCGDYEQGAAVIEVSDVPLFMGGELNMLHQWCERIPANVIAARPRLNLMALWASHATGHLQQAERLVRLLEQAIGVSVIDFLEDSPSSRELSPLEQAALLEAGVTLTSIAVEKLDLEKAFILGERVLVRMEGNQGGPPVFNPPENLRCPTLFILGLAHELQGNLVEAARLFSEAETNAQERKNPHVVALALGHLGEIKAMQGLPQQARITYERALEAAKSYSPHSSAFWGLASVGLGELAFERGDLEAAEAHLCAGVELGKTWNAWECLLPGMLGLARLHATRGEWQAAYATLDDLLERTAADTLMVRPAVEAERAAFQLQQGDLVTAAHWASTFDAAHPAYYRLQWEESALIAVQIWLAQGKQAEAKALLARLLSDAQSDGRQQFVQRIHQITSPSQVARFQRSEKIFDLIDPLSNRELEVLRLIAEGLTNPQIARKLFLSPNTLKAHTQNIYVKLDVHNRMEAVNKARDLNLL